jgi:ATP-dependent Zn protease
MREREVQRLRRVAYHEAGHAVAAVELNVAFREVSIVPADGTVGHVVRSLSGAIRRSLESGTPPRRRVEAAVMICFAGEVAEHRFSGRHDWVGAERDITSALDYLDTITESSREAAAYRTLLWIRTEQLFAKDHIWAGVEALAAALMERPTINGREARGIVQAAIQPGAR